VQPLGQWRRYDATRQELMRAALERILATPGLSPNTYEMVAKKPRPGGLNGAPYSSRNLRESEIFNYKNPETV